MSEQRKQARRKLEQRIEPFESEEERRAVRDRFRKLIEKLESWDALERLKVKVTKRDLN